MILAENSPAYFAEVHAGRNCLLNGMVARIQGRLNQYATIATIDPAGPSVVYPWPAVDRVMNESGEFTTW